MINCCIRKFAITGMKELRYRMVNSCIRKLGSTRMTKFKAFIHFLHRIVRAATPLRQGIRTPEAVHASFVYCPWGSIQMCVRVSQPPVITRSWLWPHKPLVHLSSVFYQCRLLYTNTICKLAGMEFHSHLINAFPFYHYLWERVIRSLRCTSSVNEMPDALFTCLL